MIDENKKEKLISIDELIIRAKNLGIDFGKGDPRHRLRYYTKIGLIPHAQRKCFNNNSPQGAYPESVINFLFEIDKKLKEGKSIQAIKRELGKEEKKEKIFDFSFKPFLPFQTYEDFSKFSFEEKEEKSDLETLEISEKKEIFFEEKPKKFKLKFSPLLLIFFLIFVLLFSFFQTKANPQKIFSYFTAALTNFKKLTQVDFPGNLPDEAKENVFLPTIESYYEPYLTINAETAIQGKLKVKQEIETASLILKQEAFMATFSLNRLTENRNYIFPNQSGVVCLSTGNCIGLAGEVISQGARVNRLTKFTSANRITSSSINDLYNLGVAITINEVGNVGIGTNNPRGKLEVVGDFITSNFFVAGQANGRVGIKTTNPQYDLHVLGRIQASGDICTDLAGGKCLSNLTEGGNVYIAGGGISGSGLANYLPLWTESRILGNSIIFQSGDILTIEGGLTLSRDLTVGGNLSVSGTTTMAGFILPVGANEGYILTSNSTGIGSWRPAPTSTIPQGELGYTLRHNGSLWVADDFLYNSGSLIGIGTTTPTETLSVVGSSGYNIFGFYTSSFLPVLFANQAGNVGIGTSTPSANLSVKGSLSVTGTTTFNGITYTWPLSDGSSGFVLTTDGNGVLSWSPAGGISGIGTQYYLPRWSGSMSLENSIIYSNNNFVGIATTSDLAKLTVAGSGYFLGPLTLATSSLPQLVLKYDDSNYLNFSINQNQSTILASKRMVLNSLTGEISLASNVTSFNATSARISGNTFISAANDATVRKSGELILRSSVPIFKFSVPAQTTSTSPVAISRQISPSVLNTTLPETLPGTSRYFAFLLNFADNIPVNSSSTWTIDLETGSDIQFTFAGQAMPDLEEGVARLSEIFLPPSVNWQLKTNVPLTNNTIRIFNVFLLVFDRVN